MPDFKAVEVGREAKLIGVEIECFNIGPYILVDALRARGIKVANFTGYSKQKSKNQWLVTTDASVTGTGTGFNKGLEVVSPPLTSQQMLTQLSTVCDVLETLGAKVDRTCGVHVHHEIDDLPLQAIKNIYSLYHKHIEVIEGILPSSRRTAFQKKTAGYCRPFSSEEIERINQITSVEQIRPIVHTRYKVINADGYVSRGTIEFRQHSGTVNFEKIMNWVLITQSLVASAKKKKSIRPLSAKANPTVAFNKEIGTYNTIQGVYIRDRKRQLAKKNA